MRAKVWIVALGLTGWACTKVPEPAAESAGVPATATGGSASAAVRWVPAHAAADLALFDVPAVTRAAADAAAVVSAPVRARLVQILVRAGDQLQAGDPVARVHLPELVQAAAVLRSTAERMVAHKRWLGDLRSQRSLGMAKSADVFDVEAKLADLDAQHSQAEAQLKAAGLTVGDAALLARDGLWTLRAPIGGVVRSVEGELGGVLDEGAVVARLTAERPVRIEVRLISALPANAQLQFVTTGGAVVELAAQPTATSVDPADGALLAWYEPQQQTTLSAGLRGRLRVSALAALAFEVPARALMRVEGLAYVVVESPQGARKKLVEVLALGGSVALVSGLQAGELVAAQADQVQLPNVATHTQQGK